MNMKKSILIATAISVMGFAACSDDDDDTVTPSPAAETKSSLTVESQVTSRNTITVDNVFLKSDGFAVVHRDNGTNGPVVPGIISDTANLSAGNNNDVVITLKESITDGEKLWVMIHNDDDMDGVYNFPDTRQDGSFIDGPLTVDGNILMNSININSPSITVTDQVIMNNTLVIDEVVAAKDGWLVIHHEDLVNGLGGAIVVEPIAGKVKVNAGVTTNVSIQLTTDSTYSAGTSLYPMLHVDGDGNNDYDFPGGTGMDLPEIFSNAPFPGNVIFTKTTSQ